MEQKRTLWVIAASGVFLLVVVGAALIINSPTAHRAQAAQAAFSPNDGWTAPLPNAAPAQAAANPFSAQASNNAFAASTNAPVNPFEQTSVESSSEVAAQTGSAADTSFDYTYDAASQANSSLAANASSEVPSTFQTSNVTVIADNTTVYGNGNTKINANGTTTIDLNALKTTSVTPNVTAQNATTQAQIAAAQSAAPQASAPQYVYEQPKKTASAAPVAPAQKAKPAAPASSSTVAKTTAPKSTSTVAKAASTSSQKLADKFWVQAASYSTKKSADTARETLESNKIPSEIFTYTDAKGNVFYRVRVGPYTTSTEAEYWKTQVAKIDPFTTSESYVVNSSAKAVK